MKVALIWAQDRNRAIGRGGTMPWHVPEDLAHFKSVTTGAPVIMGRKTWLSLPRGALPNRLNLVVTRQPAELSAPGALVLRGLDEALEEARRRDPEWCFVIGGAQLYEQALPVADEVHVTELDLEVEQADTFAPRVPECFVAQGDGAWQRSRSGMPFRFRRYVRSRS